MNLVGNLEKNLSIFEIYFVISNFNAHIIIKLFSMNSAHVASCLYGCFVLPRLIQMFNFILKISAQPISNGICMHHQ